MIPKETPNKQQEKARRSNIKKRNTIWREKRGSRGIRTEEKKKLVSIVPLYLAIVTIKTIIMLHTHTNDTL